MITQDKEENERQIQGVRESLDGNIDPKALKEIFIGFNREYSTTTETETAVGISPEEIKTRYESNADTNAYTDAEKTKLFGLSNDFNNLINKPPDSRYTYSRVVGLYRNTSPSIEPVGLNTPLDVSLGTELFRNPSIITSVSPTGLMTFAVAANLLIFFDFNFGRVGGTGESFVYGRLLINGVQSPLNKSIFVKIDNANNTFFMSLSIRITVEAGDTIQLQLYRDSAGDNSGGLFTFTPNLAGWQVSPALEVTVRTNSSV